MLFLTGAMAQDYNFGIRAGLNYSKFLGPQINESNAMESYSLNNGLHFGVTFGYYLSDRIGFTTEVAYNQIGSIYKFEGDSYYRFPLSSGFPPKEGYAERIFDINNSYIQIPLLFSVKPIKQLEIQAGVYAQFLIISRATGKLTFTSPNEETMPYSFIQSTDANYYSDEAGAQADFSDDLRICFAVDPETGECLEETILSLPRVVGGYYEFQPLEKKASLYNWFDAGLIGSVSYYFNNSLYARLTAQYGFFDVTDEQADIDYRDLNEEGSFIFQDDLDTNLNFGISLGFRF